MSDISRRNFSKLGSTLIDVKSHMANTTMWDALWNVDNIPPEILESFYTVIPEIHRGGQTLKTIAESLTYGDVGSFAYWNTSSDEALPENNADQYQRLISLYSDDENLFDDLHDEKGIRLTADVVFVGINWSMPSDTSNALYHLLGKDLSRDIFSRWSGTGRKWNVNPVEQPNVDSPHWRNFHPRPFPFHSPELSKNLRKLAETLDVQYSDDFRGAYMTDFYKGLPTKSYIELEKWLKKSGAFEDFNSAMVDCLLSEVEILGVQNPVWVALGNQMESVLNTLLVEMIWTGFCS